MTRVEPPLSGDQQPASLPRVRRERLYVVLQSCGWLTFLGSNLLLAQLFSNPAHPRNPLDLAAGVTQVTMMGWLLSHYVRGYVTRRGWKKMGWASLIPRILLFSVLLSGVWSALGYGYQYGLLRDPWPAHYPRLSLAFTGSIINGAIVFVGWFGLYFSYHAFNRINTSELERFRLEASVKDAELRALKAQVNPHFIFNALNSVRALIDEDPARARQAVTQLANLLRYSLQSGALETVPFEDELQVVNDYLALEQVRHEERLRLKIDVTAEALRQPVPPMLLQTLVENAVKYGISTRREGGEIGIAARVGDGRLHLRVSNPGRLAGKSTLPRAAESTGLGLKNAANRLRLLFGDQATLELRQEGADRVVADVSVPLDPDLRHVAFAGTRAASVGFISTS